MLPGRRHTTTIEAFLLPAVGGCIDAIGLLTLGGLFVSHMSGNTAAMGAFFGQGHWSEGLPHLFAVPIFVLGLFLGYLWTAGTQSYRRCGAILLIEAVLLTIFAVALFRAGSQPINTPGYFLLATPPLLAMGLQNATLRQVGRSAFPSTYVTGVLDMLGKSAAEYLHKRGTHEARSKWIDMVGAFGIWLGYSLGAIGGGAGLLFFHEAFLLVPIAVLLALAIKFWRM